MTTENGRSATKPYRVRVGGVWYWVDPTVPQSAMEPGDIVIVYPVTGDAALAILRSALTLPADEPVPERINFATLTGEDFEVPVRDIAALHLAAVDEVQ